MNMPPDEPKRPALRYYGGKWRLAEWIISHFPPHKNYVEPCGGAASVLLQKPRSPLETYNDLDGNVVNFFRVLRDRPEELIYKLKLTPWARDEAFLPLRFDGIDSIEWARRFWVKSWMIIGDLGKSGESFRVSNKISSQPSDIMRGIPYLWYWVDRMQGVQIESCDAIKLIGRNNSPETLFYFDPPYVKETRSHKVEYAVEVDNEFHVAAADAVRGTSGYAIVSGYACPLYTELYEAHGWHRVDKEAQTNSGGKRIESLWLSPRTWAALHQDVSDLPLFGSREQVKLFCD